MDYSWLGVFSMESDPSGFAISHTHPRAEHAAGSAHGSPLLLELIEGAKLAIYGLFELLFSSSCGLSSSLSARTHHLPEHGVVGVASCVVPYGGLYVIWEGV